MLLQKAFSDGEIVELRRWSRRAWLSEYRSIRNYTRLVLETARVPTDFVRSAREALRDYGASVRTLHGVPLRRQITDLVRCRIAYGLDPIAYYRFQLFRAERRSRASQFVQTGDVGRVLKWLVRSTPGYPAVFRDKRAFDQWCREHHLPSVPNLAEFEDGRLVRGKDLGIPRGDLFSKPSNWQGGRGAERWVYNQQERWMTAAGRSYDKAGLLQHLASQSAELGRPILLQRLLVNHRALRPLVKQGLCTARILTLRRPGAAADLLLGVYRMPLAPSVADNFDLGGIAAPIDISTGELGAGIRKYPRVSDGIDTHPDTGAQITGLRLPFWPETRLLVLRAHDSIAWESVPVIGWDVALLDDGPVLLEGNNVPCSTLAQMPSGMPLGATPFVECVNAHLRARFRPAADSIRVGV